MYIISMLVPFLFNRLIPEISFIFRCLKSIPVLQVFIIRIIISLFVMYTYLFLCTHLCICYVHICLSIHHCTIIRYQNLQNLLRMSNCRLKASPLTQLKHGQMILLKECSQIDVALTFNNLTVFLLFRFYNLTMSNCKSIDTMSYLMPHGLLF